MSRSLLLLAALAFAEARFGQEQGPVQFIAALSEFGDPGAAATLSGGVPSVLLANANPCAKLELADQIVAELGNDPAVIDGAKQLVAAEQNFNPFAVDIPSFCADTGLPATEELRGILPAVDPAVGGSEDINALSTQSLTVALDATGLSIATLAEANGFTNFTAVDAAGTAANAGDAAGDAAGTAAGGDAAVETVAAHDAAATTEAAVANAAADVATVTETVTVTIANQCPDVGRNRGKGRGGDGKIRNNNNNTKKNNDNRKIAMDTAVKAAKTATTGDAAVQTEAASTVAKDTAATSAASTVAGEAAETAATTTLMTVVATETAAATTMMTVVATETAAADTNGAADNNNNDAGNANNGAVAGKGASTQGTSLAGVDFGTCDPTIRREGGLNGRDINELTFQANDPNIEAVQQEALNPNIITNRICDELANQCGANDAAQEVCLQAKAAVLAIGAPDDRSDATVDLFNQALGF